MKDSRLHTVHTAASCFLLPNHLSTLMVFLLSFLITIAMCRKLCTSFPLGPSTVTTRAQTFAVTPPGTVTVLELMMVLMMAIPESEVCKLSWSFAQLDIKQPEMWWKIVFDYHEQGRFRGECPKHVPSYFCRDRVCSLVFVKDQGGRKRLPKFKFSAKFPIGLHVILQIQIKKFENDRYIM